jgi:hypothetical protein
LKKVAALMLFSAGFPKLPTTQVGSFVLAGRYVGSTVQSISIRAASLRYPEFQNGIRWHRSPPDAVCSPAFLNTP